jgi:hypothetical protein
MSHSVKSVSPELTPAEFQYLRELLNTSLGDMFGTDVRKSLHINLKLKFDALNERLNVATK